MDPGNGTMIGQLIGTVDPTALAAIVVAILGSGGVGAFLAYRKTDAEADSIAARTLIAVNTELRTELVRRDNEIAELRDRIATLEALDRQRRGIDPISPSG